ncbi:hypothetical protein GCM10009594_22720 [Kocuria palustris]
MGRARTTASAFASSTTKARVLTHYRGPNYSRGEVEITMFDSSCQQIATVTTGGDTGPSSADVCDTTMTDRATMLLGPYHLTPQDLGAGG